MPDLGSCAFPRARLTALGGSTLPFGESTPQGSKLLPRVLELAASKVAGFTSFDPQVLAALRCNVKIGLPVAVPSLQARRYTSPPPPPQRPA